MGRYSQPLAVRFADWLEVSAGQRAIDVGCGPGCADRRSSSSGSAPTTCAPSTRRRRSSTRAASGFPGSTSGRGSRRPCRSTTTVSTSRGACLVVHFMTDPVAGVGEMRRVTRPAAGSARPCGTSPAPARPCPSSGRSSRGWCRRRTTSEEVPGSARASGLEGVLHAAGLSDVEVVELAVTVSHPTFEEWWEPYLHGVGPAVRPSPRSTRAPRRGSRSRSAPQPRRRAVRHDRGWRARAADGREPAASVADRPRRVSSSGRRGTARADGVTVWIPS